MNNKQQKTLKSYFTVGSKTTEANSCKFDSSIVENSTTSVNDASTGNIAIEINSKQAEWPDNTNNLTSCPQSTAIESGPPLSQYEIFRRSNIERNAAFLSQLGIDVSSPTDLSIKPQKRKGTPSIISKESRHTKSYSLTPTRKSMRLTKADPCEEFIAPSTENVVTEVALATIDQESLAAQHFKSLPSSDGSVYNSDYDIRNEINAINVACIYTMDLYTYPDTNSSLLIAAGKGGELAFVDNTSYDQKTEETKSVNGVLMAFKAHSRWISSVKFVNSNAIDGFESLKSGNKWNIFSQYNLLTLHILASEEVK